MAAQQLVFAETITGMKRAMARADDASASDDSIHAVSNRGNKRKRRAKYVQQGRLDQADGPRTYRRRIEFNNFPRYVISRNPPKIDADGDVVEDEEDDSLEASAAEDDPYSETRIERILMPLTNAGQLDKHPALSVPYSPKILRELIKNAREVVEREQAALYRMKQVLVRLRGDEPWAPCGDFMTDHDALLLDPLRMDAYDGAGSVQALDTASSVATVTELEESIVDGGEMGTIEGSTALANGVHDAYSHLADAPSEPINGDTAKDESMQSSTVPMKPKLETEPAAQGLQVNDSMDTQPLVENGEASKTSTADAEAGEQQETTIALTIENGASTAMAQDLTADTSNAATPALNPEDTTTVATATATTVQSTEPVKPEQDPMDIDTPAIIGNGTDAKDHDPASLTAAEEAPPSPQPPNDPPHRMTTRARAAASPQPTTLPSPSPAPSTPHIHPFFSLPATSLPCAHVGLPAGEAADARRLLLIYVQKQEEVVRAAGALLAGLRRADRLRATVWRWCRSEAHVGEMSDGEDWVDGEEWGLGVGGELRKGEEEVEEEVVSGGKKTRQRRAVA